MGIVSRRTVFDSAMVICVDKDACQDAKLKMDSRSRVVPVAVVCCGKATCKGDFELQVTELEGVDVHGYCREEDACEDSKWTVAAGNKLTIDCTTDETCEDAKFEVEGNDAMAMCTGDGCSEIGSIKHRM
jgi:hypothetical protein